MGSQVFDFGEFHLDCEGLELSRYGRGLKVERKPLELLMLLVRRQGDLVTRAEIAERLWEPAVFVDTEHGINTAVRKIRQTLRDDSAQPRFVQTVPGKGYRFIATAVDVSPVPEISHSAPKAEVSVSAHRVTTKPRLVIWSVAIAGTIALAVVFLTIRSMAHQPQITSIAVLPLDNLSAQAGQDYLAAGLTDELITMLAKNSSLRITSRTSVLQYKGAKRPLRQVAQELGVDSILEGSVSRVGNHVHMTVQLIRAKTDSHLWAESYDRDADSLVSLPQDAARAVANKLNRAIPAKTLHHISPEAHDAYLQGRYLFFSGARGAGKYFEKAVDLQPDYAAAWAGLADSYMQDAVSGLRSSEETFAPGENAALTALRLDPALAQAHLSMCAMVFTVHWDWSRAESECNQAIALDPRSAEAFTFRALVLSSLNRLDEAIESEKKASDLDLFARPYAMAMFLDEARQWDATIVEARKRLVTLPHNDSLHYFLSDAYAAKRMRNEAEEALENMLADDGESTEALAVHRIFEQGGYRAVLQHNLALKLGESKKHYVSPVSIAQIYAELGDREQSLAYLENALNERSGALLWIQDDWRFDFLHSDSRYRAIIKAIGLPPAY